MNRPKFILIKPNFVTRRNRFPKIFVQSDGTILVSDLAAKFKDAINLKYYKKSSTDNAGLSYDCVYLKQINGRFLPPENGWKSNYYYQYDGIRNPAIVLKDYKDELKNIDLCPLFKQIGFCDLHLENSCPYVHGNLCELCEKYTLHPFNGQQRDRHLRHCENENFGKKDNQECAICLEVIMKKPLPYNAVAGSLTKLKPFGLLDCCKHVYCVECITKWRMEGNNSCPECRKEFKHILPNEHYVENDEKTQLFDFYFPTNPTKNKSKPINSIFI